MILVSLDVFLSRLAFSFFFRFSCCLAAHTLRLHPWLFIRARSDRIHVSGLRGGSLELGMSGRHNANIRCKAPVMKLVQYLRPCLGGRLALGGRCETVQMARRHRPDSKISDLRARAWSSERTPQGASDTDLFSATDFSAVFFGIRDVKR